MPFKSKAQMRYLFTKEPEVAKEFEEKTPKSAHQSLPEHTKDKNRLQEISKKYRRKK